jgi:hypothetical protein
VRFDKKRTAKAVYRAKRCRVLFAVRFWEKRTAKCLPCVSCSLPCAAMFPVVMGPKADLRVRTWSI